jgi:tripartite-type tricarboxylate transporter receptor subunit TctC
MACMKTSPASCRGCKHLGKIAMKFPRRQFLHLAAGAIAFPAVSRFALAQAWPTRPIRLVIPFPPAGLFDVIGRSWADKMKPLLGTVVVENIGGASTSLGAAAVAHAHPDGYTILLGGTQTHINDLLKTRPLYEPMKDLDPIASMVAAYLSIAVHPSVPVQTLKELAAYAKANPGKLSYGHSGVGTLNHLTGELFKSLTNTPEIVPVPYRGAGPVIADLISGQIPMVVVGIGAQMLEFHRAGKMRILAVTSPTRLVSAPDLPTVPPRPHRGGLHWAARSGRDTDGNRRADCGSDAYSAGRPRLPPDSNRGRVRAHSQCKSGRIPTVTCS